MDQMVKEKKKSMSTSMRNNRALIAFLLFMMVAGFAGTAYFYMQTQDLKNNPKTSQQAQDNQAANLKAKVAKLISVPADETPVIATVTDKDKLKDQPFFADAQNGDYILMFPQAKKAYIYREKENKLINVGPIAISSDTTNTTNGTTKQ